MPRTELGKTLHNAKPQKGVPALIAFPKNEYGRRSNAAEKRVANWLYYCFLRRFHPSGSGCGLRGDRFSSSASFGNSQPTSSSYSLLFLPPLLFFLLLLPSSAAVRGPLRFTSTIV